jgi:hypothetical protein
VFDIRLGQRFIFNGTCPFQCRDDGFLIGIFHFEIFTGSNLQIKSDDLSGLPDGDRYEWVNKADAGERDYSARCAGLMIPGDDPAAGYECHAAD